VFEHEHEQEHEHMIRIAVAVLIAESWGLIVGCGADVQVPTPEEECVVGGGEWTQPGDCGDTCGPAICELSFPKDDTCMCPTPGECWDGSECVAVPELEWEVCLAGGGTVTKGMNDGCAADAGADCDCGEGRCWDGAGCVAE
jgi:hypothetical protein